MYTHTHTEICEKDIKRNFKKGNKERKIGRESLE